MRSEDRMKLLDKAIEATKPVKELFSTLKDLVANVEKLANELAIITHNQHVHHHMISQMWNVQQALFKKMTEGGPDMSLPDIDSPKSKKDEPNKGPAKSDKNKPN